MASLMITMTDVFYGIGDFSQMIFRGMKTLGHGPNIILWSIIAFLLAYQVLEFNKGLIHLTKTEPVDVEVAFTSTFIKTGTSLFNCTHTWLEA